MTALGEIDRVQKLAESAKLIHAFQRVNAADRQAPKKDREHPEDQADKLELSTDQELPVVEGLEVVPGEIEDDESGHLDIAV